jgi:hypothetical protein
MSEIALPEDMNPVLRPLGMPHYDQMREADNRPGRIGRFFMKLKGLAPAETSTGDTQNITDAMPNSPASLDAYIEQQQSKHTQMLRHADYVEKKGSSELEMEPDTIRALSTFNFAFSLVDAVSHMQQRADTSVSKKVAQYEQIAEQQRTAKLGETLETFGHVRQQAAVLKDQITDKGERLKVSLNEWQILETELNQVLGGQEVDSETLRHLTEEFAEFTKKYQQMAAANPESHRTAAYQNAATIRLEKLAKVVTESTAPLGAREDSLRFRMKDQVSEAEGIIKAVLSRRGEAYTTKVLYATIERVVVEHLNEISRLNALTQLALETFQLDGHQPANRQLGSAN